MTIQDDIASVIGALGVVPSLAAAIFGAFYGVKLYRLFRADTGHGGTTTGYNGKQLGRIEQSLGNLRSELGAVQEAVGEVREAQARAEERQIIHDREIERLRDEAGTVDRRVSDAMSKVAARCQEIIDPLNTELRERVLELERRVGR